MRLFFGCNLQQQDKSWALHACAYPVLLIWYNVWKEIKGVCCVLYPCDDANQKAAVKTDNFVTFFLIEHYF
jgi:hypothetical protein